MPETLAGNGHDEKVPISVLTGFLGSGKTTFLRRALSSAACPDTAVVINEIGEIGLDHYLVETADGPVLELPGGCLCCAVREDLAATFRGLLARRDAAGGRMFQRMVIETTGLADPAPILFTLGADAVLDRRLRFDRMVTAVDATLGAATLDRFSEAARQVAMADCLLITKTDLAPYDTPLRRRIEGLNRDAEQFIGAGEIDAAAVLFGSAPAAMRPRPSTAPGEHTHGVASFAVVLRRGCSRVDFARALGGLARDRGEDLLRIKGLVQFTDRPGEVGFLQGAQHALYPPVWLKGWPDTDRRSRLVFVVHRIERQEILERFAFAGAEPFSPPPAGG